MSAQEWFSQMLEEAKGHPEFVAETISLQIIADLCEAMRRGKLSKKELAARVGVSPAFVSQVLNGKPNMTLLTLAKFAVALDLDCHVRLSAKQPELAIGLPVKRTLRKKGLQQPQPRVPSAAAGRAR